MPTRWNTFPIECREGLITNLPEIQLGMKLPGSASRLTNFEVSTAGGYRRINGYTKWDDNVVPASSSTSQINGVAFFDGDVLAVREDKIHTSTGSGWTQIATGRSHTGKHRFHEFNFDGTPKLIGVAAGDTPYTWDGTTFTEITGSSDVNGATHVVEFKDHVFYAKNDLVTFSAPFDETDFTVANGAGSFRMPEDITGLFVFRQRLFIFTERQIKVLDGTSVADWTLTSVSRDVGCIEPDTIQEVGTDVAFMGPDGIRLLGATDRIGDFSNAIVSKAIQSEIVDFKDSYTSFSSVTIKNKSQYRIMGFTSGRESTLTDGYIATQLRPEATPDAFAWSRTRGIKAYVAWSCVCEGVEYQLFADETEYIYRMDSGSTFDGTAIEASYWTPFISFEDPAFRKTLYRATMYFDPEGDITGTVTVKYDQNNAGKIQPSAIDLSASGGGAVYGTAVFGTATYADAPTATIQKTLVGAGSNASLQFLFTGESPFVIDTITIEYATEGRT